MNDLTLLISTEYRWFSNRFNALPVIAGNCIPSTASFLVREMLLMRFGAKMFPVVQNFFYRFYSFPQLPFGTNSQERITPLVVCDAHHFVGPVPVKTCKLVERTDPLQRGYNVYSF